jgi:hypothetical protein
MNNWQHKDIWSMGGQNFMVQVSRHYEPVREASACFDSDGPHRWCVYVYIYPKHPLFAAFDGTEKMWQDAATQMPLHGGPSLCRMHFNTKGEITSYQVGADYHHLHDWHFTQHATQSDAAEVFSDADQLHAWLTERAKATGAEA